MDDIQLEWIPKKRLVAELKDLPENPRKITEGSFEKLVSRIKARGFHDVLKLDTNDFILSGNQRKKALTHLKVKEVNTLMPNRPLTADERKQIILESNRNDGIWDFDILGNQFEEEDLLDAGFSEIEIKGIEFFDDPGEKKDDDVPEVPEDPQTVRGDIYEFGGHRVMCGDSTLEEDMEKLMDGHTADMVFTDPPYNVDYKGTGDNTSEGIMNDKMDDEAFHKFLTAAFLMMNKFTNERGGCYVFHSHKTASTFEKTLQDSGFHIDTQLIWNKPSAGLGMNAYRTKHEPFFYCYIESPYFYGDRTGTTVWKIPEDIEAQIAWFKKSLEKIEQENVTLWSMKREDVSDYVHPTQKPVELVVRAILNSSKSKDIVLDQFLGSGTTLIAAEKARRRCFGCELDPKYLDVAITRYTQYTGISMITKNGQPFEWK